jgi:DNA-binding response OmpR family regulator
MSILIVDDDVLFARALARVLGRSRSVLFTATSAEQAARLLSTQAPSLVLTDLDLGGAADGIDLICWMRDAGFTIPIVVMTGSARSRARAELSRAGLDEIPILGKPFPMQQLMALVAERDPAGAREARS